MIIKAQNKTLLSIKYLGSHDLLGGSFNHAIVLLRFCLSISLVLIISAWGIAWPVDEGVIAVIVIARSVIQAILALKLCHILPS